MIVFKIGASDYSNRVVAGSYSVNSQDVYKSWEDINKIEHREKIRERITGTFDMCFLNISEYDEFNASLEAVKQPDLSYRVVICDNKKNVVKEIDAFISFTLTRNVNGRWNPIYEKFKVNIQER